MRNVLPEFRPSKKAIKMDVKFYLSPRKVLEDFFFLSGRFFTSFLKKHFKLRKSQVNNLLVFLILAHTIFRGVFMLKVCQRFMMTHSHTHTHTSLGDQPDENVLRRI